MAQRKKKNIKKIVKLPEVKKELKDFIVDEQGKMTRKDVTKLGVSLAVLGMMMQQSASGGITHTNSISATGTSNCATHTNVTTNEFPTAHSNHSDGGWMC